MPPVSMGDGGRHDCFVKADPHITIMCGRVIQSSTPFRLAIVEGLGVRNSRVHNYPPRWNGAPSQELLVIRRDQEPQDGYVGPWTLEEVASLPAGDHFSIALARTARRAIRRSTIARIAFLRLVWLAQAEPTFTLRTVATDSPMCEFRCAMGRRRRAFPPLRAMNGLRILRLGRRIKYGTEVVQTTPI